MLVRGGTYFLTEPFTLSPEDSGSAAAPVVYAAYQAEHPVLSGGRQLSGWKPATVAGRHLWTTEIADIRDGKWVFRELWVDGARRIRLTTLGFLQYLSPTITLSLAIFGFGEPFTKLDAVAFGCIWAALVIVAMESHVSRASRPQGSVR